MNVQSKIVIGAAAIAAIGMFSSCDLKPAPVNSDLYPAPWQDAVNVGIARALVANGVSGCGEHIYRQSRTDPMGYLVHCSRDGKTWRAYLVHTNSGQVDGPYRTVIEQ